MLAFEFVKTTSDNNKKILRLTVVEHTNKPIIKLVVETTYNKNAKRFLIEHANEKGFTQNEIVVDKQ